MDLIALAMAKKYTDEQRIAYSAYETESHVSFNGDVADKEVIPGETLGVSGNFVHASDEVFTGGTPTKAKIRSEGNFVYDVRNLRVDVSDDGIWMLFGEIFSDVDGGRLLALSLNPTIAQMLGVSAGTYVWTDTISSVFHCVYVISGRFVETIHPIDPKYLPDESVTEAINLSAFTTTENADFNTVLFLNILQSAQSGGALQTQTVHDASNALRTACSVGNRIMLKARSTSNGHPVFVEFPTMRSMEGGVAAQLSSSSLLATEGTVLDVQMLLVFLTDSDSVDIYLKATPLI